MNHNEIICAHQVDKVRNIEVTRDVARREILAYRTPIPILLISPSPPHTQTRTQKNIYIVHLL